MQLQIRQLLAPLKKGLIIDLRSLGLLRIGVGITLFIDLVFRFQYIQVFYSDDGLLPRSSVITKLSSDLISLHMANGTELFQGLLLLIQVIFSIFLIFGFRTRIFSLLSWMLFISLFNRNPFINFGADYLLLYLLLLGNFLPWGERFSLDRQFKHNSIKLSNQIINFGTMGYLAHIFMLYFFSGANKLMAQNWQEGHALFYALRYPPFHKSFSDFLMQIPSFITFLNYGTIIFELLIPFVIIFPFKNNLLRLFAFFFLFLFHFGIDLSLELGLFSWIAIAGLLGILPSTFWGWIEKTDFHFPDKKYFFWYYAHDQKKSQYSSFPYIQALLIFLIILYTLLLNIQFLFKLNFFSVQNLKMPASFIQLSTRWDMFADIDRNYFWITPLGQTTDGTKINLITDSTTINLQIPTYSSWLYHDQRWKKYLFFVHSGYLADELSRYICIQWNIDHSQNKIQTITLFLSQGQILNNGDLQYLKSKRIYTVSCI